MSNDHLEKGKQLFYKAYYKEALEEFKKVLNNTKSDEEEADIYFWMGRCAFRSQKYDNAIIHYEKALELSPENILYEATLGLVYSEKQDEIKAKEIAVKILGKEPKTEYDYCGFGLIKNYQKDYDGAISDYTRAIEISSKVVAFHYNRGLTKFEKQEYDDAIADFTETINLEPEYVEAYYNRGAVKDKIKDYSGAIADFIEAIKINPNYKNAENLKIQAEAKKSQDEFKLSKKEYDALESQMQILKVEFESKFNDLKTESQSLVEHINTKKSELESMEKKFQNDFEKHEDKFNALERKNSDLLDKTEKLNQNNEMLLEEIKIHSVQVKDTLETTGKLKSDVDELKIKAEKVLRLGFIGGYNKQSKVQFKIFAMLRIAEALIYIVLAITLYYFVVSGSFDKLFDQKEDLTIMIFKLLIKIGIFVPVYFLVRLINQTANRFSQRSELDNDIAAQWNFFQEKEDEWKLLLKDNKVDTKDSEYTELYKKFMEQNITLRQKTNFELLEEIMAKRSDKTPSLKQIDALVDTAKKIIDVRTPSAPTDENNKKS